MSDSKTILVVHPDSRVRALLRSLLEDQGRNVWTGHSWSDLLSDPSGDAPAVILMDRSYLGLEGLGVLSLCCRKWTDTEVVLLPDGFETASSGGDSFVQLLGHVDRLLSMKSTRELLAAPEGTR